MNKKEKDNIWIFTFEYARVAKVGGLGEVPPNQAENLTDYFDFTVFMPSHGQIKRFKDQESYKRLSFECNGKFDPAIIKEKTEEMEYKISFHRVKINGVNIVLLSGENSLSSKFLDDDNVYNPDTIDGKFYLYARGMQCYIRSLLKDNIENLPNLIHMHDHHVLFPFLNIKQELNKRNLEIPSIITIHLLTYPRKDIDFYKLCGIDNTPIKIRFKNGFKSLTLKEVFELAKDEKKEKSDDRKPPTVEKIAAIVSDLVTSVSESYLKSDVIPECGGELIEFKSDFVWDGCDWQYKEIHDDVIKNHEKDIRRVLNIPNDQEITQIDMKKYLLTHKIGNLDKSPLIRSEKVIKAINEISNGNQFVKDGRIKAFETSGPLAITTGRVSPQKGFDVILESIPDIIEVIPNAKFLLLVLPTDYSIEEIKEYSGFVKKFPENLRIIFGIAPDVFNLAHIASDAYCAISRWEPFGIMALEAMASKLPVIGTKVGGIQETVLDLRELPNKGTGILIEKDNKKQFIEAVINIFRVAQIYERETLQKEINENRIEDLLEDITYEEIKTKVKDNPQYFLKIKEYCYNRVENHFRWRIVSKKLINLYSDIQQIHNS
jgi:starch synthase